MHLDEAPSVDFMDYRREKYALLAVAEVLVLEGYSTVRLSVPPDQLGATDLASAGKAVPSLDRARASSDWRYGHSFHYDTPGTIDLVASGSPGLLVGEAKGVSRATVEGRSTRVERSWDLAEAVIGRLVLLAYPTEHVVYAAILPDLPGVRRALGAARADNPILSTLSMRAYLVEAHGNVKVMALPMSADPRSSARAIGNRL